MRRLNPDVDFGFRISGFGFFLLIPGRYAMSPPHLTADTPVANVLQPLRVNLFPVRWKETDEVITDNCQRFLRFRVTQEPLLTESRFDRHVAAVAEPDVVLIWLGLRQKSRRLQ